MDCVFGHLGLVIHGRQRVSSSNFGVILRISSAGKNYTTKMMAAKKPFHVPPLPVIGWNPRISPLDRSILVGFVPAPGTRGHQSLRPNQTLFAAGKSLMEKPGRSGSGISPILPSTSRQAAAATACRRRCCRTWTAPPGRPWARRRFSRKVRAACRRLGSISH